MEPCSGATEPNNWMVALGGRATEPNWMVELSGGGGDFPRVALRSLSFWVHIDRLPM